MAAARSLKDIGKHLECAVCLEQFQDPKVLLCLHTYCKKCLEKIQKTSGNRSVVACPECRMETEIPKGKLDLLQKNFFVNNIMSAMALQGESKTVSVSCDNCDNGEPPSARCSVCSLFLCDFCAEAHRRMKQTKSHKLMSMEDMKSSGPATLSRPTMCEEHMGETLKLYCQTCEKAICRDCTMVKHRQHRYLFVKDAYTEEKGAILNLLRKANSKGEELKQAIAKVSKTRTSVEATTNAVERDINLWINKLIYSLEQRRTELHQSLRKLSTSKVKELQIQQEQLEVAFSCVQSSIDFTERAFQDGSQVEVLEMKKQISEHMSKLSSSTWKLEPCTCATVYFIPQKSLGDSVQRVGCVKDHLVCAAKSTVRLGRAEDGVMYNLVCGQTRDFHIQARNNDGSSCNVRADGISVDIKGPNGNVSRNLKLLESDHKGTGSYHFFYKPEAVGTYTMSVKINGENIRGSPFTWQAHDWQLSNDQKRSCRLGNSQTLAFTPRGCVSMRPQIKFTPTFLTVENASLNSGRFSWKIQSLGPLAVGIKENIIYQHNHLTNLNASWDFPIRPALEQVAHKATQPHEQVGKEWLWTVGTPQNAHQTPLVCNPTPQWNNVQLCPPRFNSQQTPFAHIPTADWNDKELKIYLDLDHKRLLIEHQSTSALETMDISGVVCPVSPFFRLDSRNSTLSLF